MPSPKFIAIVIAVACFCSSAAAQLTPETIAASISADAGASAEQYRKYSEDLSKTLGLLSHTALADVFGPTTVVIPTLNEHLELEPINFPNGSSELAPASLAELDSVAEFLISNPDATIAIEGHTGLDKPGMKKLSEDRANAAMAYLASMGIDPGRLETHGYGGRKPIVKRTKKNENIEANRRIEIKVK